MNKKDKAIQVLSHYMRMAFAESGLDWDYDSDSDIELIVDNIISAAVDETTSIMIKYFQGKYGNE